MADELGMKAITHIPGWHEDLQIGGQDKLNHVAQAYALVPLIFRAVKLRAGSLAKVPFQILDGENVIDWPFPIKPKRLIWYTEAGLMLRGAAYFLKIQNALSLKNLVYLNPFSIEQEYQYNRDTGEDNMIFRQPVTGQGPWDLEEMVYIREFDPLQDTHPGISSAMVSMGDSQLLNYVTRFAWHFFEGGAMPVTVLGFQNTGKEEARRVESRIKRAITRLSNAFNVVGVKSDHVSINTLTPELASLALPELRLQAKQDVGAAFGIPVSMLEEPSANRATAESHRQSFWADTVRPEGEDLIQEEFNDQIFNPLGLEFQFLFDELDIFQEDERARAQSVKAYVEAGMPIDLAVEILGVDMNDDQKARLTESIKLKEERAQAFAESNPFSNSSSQDDDDDDDDSGQKSTFHGDLKKWQRKAIARIKQKKNPAVNFESEHIPPGLKGAIMGALESARNPRDIYRIFDGIWGDYP